MMRKSLLYKLFRIGAIPGRLQPVLDAEQIVVKDEGMRGTLTYKNVKGPGKRCINRVEGFTGWLAVTQKRIVCFTFRKRQINIGVDDQKVSKLLVEIPQHKVLSISFEASDFMEKWQGIMQLRFKTGKADEFYQALTAIGAGQG